MAIKVGGTEVVDNNRQLKNIASVDSTTVTALSNAGVGSGGGKFSATADGAIAAGKPVSLQSNGTVKIVSNPASDISPITLGTERQVAPGTSNPTYSYGNVYYYPDIDAVIYVYEVNGDIRGHTSYYNDANQTWQTRHNFYAGDGHQLRSLTTAFDATNGYLFIAWNSVNGGFKQKMFKFAVSGSTLDYYASNLITETNYGNIRSSSQTAMAASFSETDGHFRLAIINEFSNIHVITYQPTGTTSPALTAKGSANMVTSVNNTEDIWMAYDSDNNRFLLTTRNNANNDDKGYYYYFSTSTSNGTTTLHASNYFYSGGFVRYTRCEYNAEDNCFVVFFHQSTGSGIKQLDVSGTSITVVDGAANFLSDGASAYREADLAYDSIGRKIILARSSASNSDHMEVSKIVTSGSSPSKTDAINLHTSGIDNAFGLTAITEHQRMLGISEKSNGDMAYRTFQTAAATSNNTSWIGFAESAISDSASGDILVVGSTAENQSGLTIGSTYYVQEDGTLATTTSNAIKVGRAIAANKLLITEGNAS